MSTQTIDRIALRLTYDPAVAARPTGSAASAWVPADFALSDKVTFSVWRASKRASDAADFTEVMEFLHACGIGSDVQALSAVFAGTPFDVDGVTMQLQRDRW